MNKKHGEEWVAKAYNAMSDRSAYLQMDMDSATVAVLRSGSDRWEVVWEFCGNLDCPMCNAVLAKFYMEQDSRDRRAKEEFAHPDVEVL